MKDRVQTAEDYAETASSPEEELRGQQAIRKWRSNSSRGLRHVELLNAHILVIDDDLVQRTLLNKWLADEGYKNGKYLV
jgi:PleD family two-component response regulator